MAQVQRSAATLRISGDDLQPAEITRLLGCDPSAAQAKGDQIIGRNTGSARIASTGMWRLVAFKREPEDLDGQITELLSKVTDDLNVWGSIARTYQLDLFCSLFMGGSNEGLSISPESMIALGLRHIELDLDLYGVDEAVSKDGDKSDLPKRSSCAARRPNATISVQTRR
jgi:Domain of unknown function (DUF4279)